MTAIRKTSSLMIATAAAALFTAGVVGSTPASAIDASVHIASASMPARAKDPASRRATPARGQDARGQNSCKGQDGACLGNGGAGPAPQRAESPGTCTPRYQLYSSHVKWINDCPGISQAP